MNLGSTSLTAGTAQIFSQKFFHSLNLTFDIQFSEYFIDAPIEVDQNFKK